MNFFQTTLDLAFAGAWAYLWHWGLGIGLIVLFIAGYFFTPAILSAHRVDFLWAAAIVFVFLTGEATGDKEGRARCVTKTEIIQKDVVKVVRGTASPASRAKKDKFDDPSN